MKKEWRYAILVLIFGLLIVGLFESVNQALISRWQNLSAVVAGRVVELANSERTRLHLPTLAKSELLTEAAQKKAEDMATRGYFSHEGPDGEAPWIWLTQNGYEYQAAGENLAINFDDSELLDKAWIDSPTHRANILRSDFKEIGVGIARGRYKNSKVVFVVQFFATPVLQ